MAQNSTTSALVRGRPFRPGHSGNPGGRPKVAGRVRDLARAHTEKAVSVLVESLDDADARVRLTAANMLLDRAWGKAVNIVDDTCDEPPDPPGTDMSRISAEERRQLAQLIARVTVPHTSKP